MAKALETSLGGAILTARLPQICPACACRELDVVDDYTKTAGAHKVVTCRRPCRWSERYILEEAPR